MSDTFFTKTKAFMKAFTLDMITPEWRKEWSDFIIKWNSNAKLIVEPENWSFENLEIFMDQNNKAESFLNNSPELIDENIRAEFRKVLKSRKEFTSHAALIVSNEFHSNNISKWILFLDEFDKEITNNNENSIKLHEFLAALEHTKIYLKRILSEWALSTIHEDHYIGLIAQTNELIIKINHNLFQVNM